MTAISSDPLPVEGCDRRLVADGLPVPPGFVVLAEAFDSFRQQTHLGRRLHQLLDGLDVEDPDDLQATAAQATAAVRETPMPEWLAEAIAGAYFGLVAPDTDGPVEVRLSASAPRTGAPSPAQLDESALLARGAEETIAAVRRCWSSRFDARSLYDRAPLGLNLAQPAIAVEVARRIASGGAS